VTFANTGLLALTALFAVPLVIHLLNRRRYRRVPWAAMEFLLRAYKQNRRRLRLENLLLLLLRCALPVLLALAVARPRFESAPLGMGNQGRHHVLLLDRSYSMAYRDAGGSRPFDRLKQSAGLLLDLVAKRQNEKVSLVLFGGQVGTPWRRSRARATVAPSCCRRCRQRRSWRRARPRRRASTSSPTSSA
jgi:hypothetical protein